MFTDVTIVARSDASIHTSATGGLAVRRTGPSRLHLISTAATPLGGDEIKIRVVVEAGARLELGSVAATIALPAAGRADSSTRWLIEVDEGGELACDPEPTIVAGGADHTTSTVARLHSDSRVRIAEHVQIGRGVTDAAIGGRWSGSMRVDVGEHPVLRHRLVLGPGEISRGHRGLSSTFVYPDPRPEMVSSKEYAARLRLAAVPGAGIADPSGTPTLTTVLADRVFAAREIAAELS
ncbi:urease accessory protein UreD [Gordonia amarae]|uniref:Urease accessory protein UreD n=2 Tax=Gordonia amarae TaxID=36821 RepID=G7GJ94_9ACTN|nr:urease accessory protein UreD [Gordonia amarae]MCS3879324.1 urease accessory protein [Gordonia amarae]QHN17812.1 urease accessory protein UreD [Gordonia amarae]QHN22343.1 urease accessory protein UreD [Gordonia amarae]QHN31219.1 urease accessory protein UreD [Gordonia amarae]QHN39964.1 urease accessory protein UreD [Gordonia amarae]